MTCIKGQLEVSYGKKINKKEIDELKEWFSDR